MNSNGKTPINRQAPQRGAQTQNRSNPQNTGARNAPSQRPSMQNPQNRSQAPKRQPPIQKTPSRKKPSDLSDNLRSQTPLQRQMRKQNQPSEPGTVRRKATQQFKIRQSGQKPQKKVRAGVNRSFGKRVLILGAIGYLILLPIAILTVSLLLRANVATSTDDFRYQLGEGKNTVYRKTYAYSRVCRDGVYYVDMDSIAEYCTMTTTGDGKNMRYVVRSTSESVEFVIGESIAYINGVPERTGGNAFMYAGKVHIPLEFAQRCFNNLEITLDTERNRITIVRKTDSRGEYLDLDFPYKVVSENDRIIFGELEVEIQEQIIKQNQPTLPEGEGENELPVNN